MSKQKTNHCFYLFFIFSFIFVTSCTVGPDYQPISIEIPNNYKELKDGKWKIAEPKDEHDKGKWWEIFADSTLNSLEEQLIISNQTIAVALAQYEQAQALLAQAKGGYFPSINGSANVTKQRQQVTTTSSANEFTNYNMSLNASWIPDLWGSVRRTVEASKAGEEANKAQLANVKLTAQTSLAQYYFQLRTADNNQKMLDDTVENYKKSLEIIEHHRSAGIMTMIDYTQAQTQLEQAQAQAFDNNITRSQYEHAIATLIGKTPSQFSIEAKLTKLVPPEIPIVVPSALLERRPDIAQAERLAKQANEQIGVTTSAYFPNLNLNANAGYSNNSYTDLLNLPALFWTLGANLSEIIFDGGIREAKINAAKASYKASVAQYRQIVLNALQNVEDNLVAARILKLEEEKQKNSALNAQLVENLTNQAFDVGTKTYSDVIAAQTNSFSMQKTANDIIGRRMITAVSLIAALGEGGLNTRLQLKLHIQKCSSKDKKLKTDSVKS